MTDTPAKHPGKILYEQVMVPLGVSRNKLARDIDVPVGRISDIVAGKRGVTPDTALRFAKYFGTTPELWLRLQADYDLYVAVTTTWRTAEPKVAVFEQRAPLAAPGSAPLSPSGAGPAPKAAAPAPAGPVSGLPATNLRIAPAPQNPAPTELRSEPASPPTAGINDDDDEDEDIDIPEPVSSAGQAPRGDGH